MTTPQPPLDPEFYAHQFDHLDRRAMPGFALEQDDHDDAACARNCDAPLAYLGSVRARGL